MNTLFSKIENHLDKQLPFVVYRKPYSDNLCGVFQKNQKLFLINDYKEQGFAFCSFDAKTNIIIPKVASDIFLEKISYDNLDFAESNFIKENKIKKQKHINLVQSGIEAIHQDKFSKVVLSRVETIKPNNFNITEVFKKLLNQYKNAFVYVFYHPTFGIWMGAFAEQLLKINQDVLQTMSVAGTQKFNSGIEIIWSEKEKNEQQIVTDFIANNLKNSITNLIVSKPYNFTAGNVVHLKSDIEANLIQNFSLENIIQFLHPTPAVCGFPKEVAKKFILENENYDREFYAGFLGELNWDNSSCADLYVNLRCMKITKEVINIYVGGGITTDSIPEKEWEETVAKSTTISTVLNF